MTEPCTKKDWVATIIVVSLIIMAFLAVAYAASQIETRPHQTEQTELSEVSASIKLQSNNHGIMEGANAKYYTYATVTFKDSAGYNIESGYYRGQIKTRHHNLESVITPEAHRIGIALDAIPRDYYIKITNLERNTTQTLSFTIDAEYNLEVEP